MQVSLSLLVLGSQTGIPDGLKEKIGNLGEEEWLMILLEGRGG